MAQDRCIFCGRNRNEVQYFISGNGLLLSLHLLGKFSYYEIENRINDYGASVCGDCLDTAIKLVEKYGADGKVYQKNFVTLHPIEAERTGLINKGLSNPSPLQSLPVHRCHFCDKGQTYTSTLVVGYIVCMCNECLDKLVEVLEEKRIG